MSDLENENAAVEMYIPSVSGHMNVVVIDVADVIVDPVDACDVLVPTKYKVINGI